MSEWQTVPFNELFTIPLKNGLTRPKAVRGEGVQMVNMGEIFAHSRIGNIQMDKVPLTEREHSFLLEPKDLLFARQSLVLSGAGKCVLFTWNSEPVVFESHIIRARLNPDCADANYYFYFFNSTMGRELIEEIVEQVAAAGIRSSDLANLRVPKPPLEEQKRIAHILGTLDDKIELNRRMNATLEEIARTVFKAWFVDFEPFGGTMPEDWRIGQIREVADVNAQSIGKEYPFGEIEYIDIASVSEGQLTDTTPYRLQDAPSRARRIVKHGDTIWSMVRPNRRSFRFIHQPEPNLIVSTGFAVLSPKQISPSYLYAWTTTQEFTDYLTSSADGSAYPAVSPERFGEAEIVVPSKDAQDEFERLAGTCRDKIAANEKENRTLAKLRDALLPKLLSGEILTRGGEGIDE